MADRTYLELQVYHCPADQAAALLEVIAEYGLTIEDDDTSGALQLATNYWGDEVRCGSAAEIAKKLQEHSPGASWECWEAPKYEWLGDLYRFTPELGPFTALCDADGEPVFTRDEVRHLVENAAANSDDNLDRILGELHQTALVQLAARAAQDGVDRVVASTAA